jgi:putative ABC transport system permease protein
MLKRIIISIKFAIKNLRHNKGRTVLTLVGIVIGIMSVIVVMSSGQGVKDYILGQFSSYGDNLIQVETKVPAISKNSAANATQQAQGVTITTLKVSDGDALMKIPNVIGFAAGTIGQEVVSHMSENKQTMLYGVGANWPLIDTATKVQEGEFYTQAQDDSLDQVVVIGPDLKTALFGSDDAIGKSVKIKGMDFRVIGVLQKRGVVTFINYDELAYIPVQTLEKKILGIDYVRFVSVQVKDVAMIDVTAADITDTMRRLHNIKNPTQDDFSVSTMQEAVSIISNVFGTINILLLALTSISLIVGGIGIMNVMYVAVVERTFEIGLRKAVGAKNGEILRQFLFEAIIITLLGGLVGIILGFLLTKAFSLLLSSLGFSLSFPISLSAVLVAVGFSAATGILFGFYPAWKASKLSPMEALRKE